MISHKKHTLRTIETQLLSVQNLDIETFCLNCIIQQALKHNIKLKKYWMLLIS
jgi:hypothetical protein